MDLNEEFSTPRHRNRKKQDGASGRGRSSSESFSPGPEPQQGQVATVPEEWVDTDGITHGHAPSDALQPEPIASRLVKTRPRSLSDFTFPSRGAEYHQSNYGEQSHESYPALEPFHGGSSHQDSFQFSNYRYMSEPPTSGQSSTPITEIAAPQPIQPQPNFYSLMQQALQVSSLESSKDSYRPNNQGFAF